MFGEISAYEFAKWIIIFEFGLVIFFILLTFVLKTIYGIRAKRIREIHKQIELYLVNLEPHQELIFPKKWLKLEYIIPIVGKLNPILDQEKWKIISSDLFQLIVLPLARKATINKRNYNWVQRFYAAEAFRISPSVYDEKYILGLVNDTIPLVYLTAIHAGVALGSKIVIYAIILQLAKQRRLTQGAFLEAFEHASPEVIAIIVATLNESHDPYIRTVCYKILLQSPFYEEKLDLRDDLASSNFELRIAAAKYLTLQDKDEAIPTLVNLLKDPHWEVRVAVINCLGKLNAQSAIPDIADCLRDREWWVRINAGQVLKRMGEAGIKMLEAQDPTKDKFAFDVAQSLLKKN